MATTARPQRTRSRFVPKNLFIITYPFYHHQNRKLDRLKCILPKPWDMPKTPDIFCQKMTKKGAFKAMPPVRQHRKAAF